MKSKLVKTGSSGIYRRHTVNCPGKRCDCNYVATWWDRGRQRKKSFRTLAEAKEGKRLNEQAVASGGSALTNKVLLHDYALDWIERYRGTGKRGYRETTRDGDRRLLKKYALTYFPPRTLIKDVTPMDVAKFVDWLMKQPARPKGKKRQSVSSLPKLQDDSIRNALKPLKTCLSTAVQEGVISHNPARDAVLPHRPRIEGEHEKAMPFPGNTMELVVELVKPEHRLLFEVLSQTGLRRSEILALEGRHLRLNGDQPEILVRQALIKRDGHGLVLTPPKSKQARRGVPISAELADKLQGRDIPEKAPVFANEKGAWLNPDNLYARVLRPAMTEAGINEGGFHMFRHTVASRLFADNRNLIQVQKFLGHSDPAFTLKTYVHLLDGDLGGPLTSRGNVAAMNGLKTNETVSGDLTVPVDW